MCGQTLSYRHYAQGILSGFCWFGERCSNLFQVDYGIFSIVYSWKTERNKRKNSVGTRRIPQEWKRVQNAQRALPLITCWKVLIFWKVISVKI